MLRVAHRTDPAADPADESASPLDTTELESRGARGLTTGQRVALRRRLSPRWVFFSVAVLGLLGVSLWLRYTAPLPTVARAPEPRPNSIGVLPLVNASPDAANEYLSDGMTEELIAALGRVPGLRVAAASSAFTLKGREDPREAGRRLNVGTVLEGSVRRTNDRLRITVHLVSVSEGFDLWSETYERLPGDIFAVQNEIARSVVSAMRLPGGAAPAAPPRAPTGSLDAYTAYLRARYAEGRPGGADPSRAAALFQEAIAGDSSFAPAWAGLADAQVQRAMKGGARPVDAMPAARAAAVRALALDTTLAAAHGTLGVVRFVYDWDWARADSAFVEALALNPNRPEVHREYAHMLAALGRTNEALLHARRAEELTPLDPETIADRGWQYLVAGRYADARESLDRALALDSTRSDTRYLLGLLAEAQGDYELAESHYRGALDRAQDDVEALAALGRTHALGGRPDDARGVLAKLDSLSTDRYVSPYLLATIGEALGDSRRAFAWLEEAVADRASQLVYVGVDSRLDRLRGDRRFARVRRSVGLP